MPVTVPGRIGKYDIVREIGRGGMGTVYLGHDPFSHRDVAIKIAHGDQLRHADSGAQFRKLFFNEAYTAGLLTHPNIVRVHDAGVDEDHCFIVMEHVPGGTTLKSVCQAGSLLPVERVVEILFKCARALEYAHGQGVIHRDIKPGNILMTPEHDIKIGDFSIAYLNKLESEQTLLMGVIGSPRYMSPEQITDQPLTGQTDIFSLGLVMYEMLTGKHPFNAQSVGALMQKIVNEAAAPIRSHRPELPPVLDAIVAKALAKKTAERYADAQAFASALSGAFEQLLHAAMVEIDSEESFNRVRKLSFFEEIGDRDLRDLIKAGSWVFAEPGKEFIVEGDIDDSFYVLIEGNASVRKGGLELSVLKPGDCIGEMGYLMRTKRSATIVAVTPVQLLRFNATIMSKTSTNTQLRFLRTFLRTTILRLSETIERLTQKPSTERGANGSETGAVTGIQTAPSPVPSKVETA
jgi:serine/threonine protein kinase